jgi:hypothetical protein
MTEISMDKKYRARNGRPARVICVDAKGAQPVVALVYGGGSEFVINTSLKGEFFDGDLHELDLIEVSPYEDFEVDEPVMVRDHEDNRWLRKYFAGVDGDGKPSTWVLGSTKWTSGGKKTSWGECRRPTPEELKG